VVPCSILNEESRVLFQRIEACELHARSTDDGRRVFTCIGSKFTSGSKYLACPFLLKTEWSSHHGSLLCDFAMLRAPTPTTWIESNLKIWS